MNPWASDKDGKTFNDPITVQPGAVEPGDRGAVRFARGRFTATGKVDGVSAARVECPTFADPIAGGGGENDTGLAVYQGEGGACANIKAFPKVGPNEDDAGVYAEFFGSEGGGGVKLSAIARQADGTLVALPGGISIECGPDGKGELRTLDQENGKTYAIRVRAGVIVAEEVL